MKIVFTLVFICLFVNNSHGRGTGTHSRVGGSHINQLNIGLIAPHTNFGRREYLRAINLAVQSLQKGRGLKLTFLKDHEFTTANIHFDMMSLTPSPTGWTFILIHIWMRQKENEIKNQFLFYSFSHKFSLYVHTVLLIFPLLIQFSHNFLPLFSVFCTAILNTLCKDFLQVNVSAILYMMNYEQYGRSTASAQYFLQVWKFNLIY